MSNDGRYNGWRNYATWRVALECFDGMEDGPTTAEGCEEYVEECILYVLPEGIGKDYARAFLSDVDWREIAEHNKGDDEGEG